MKPLTLLTLVAALLASSLAHAFEFRSIGSSVAILYDAPSQRGIQRFVAPPGMPVEVVLVSRGWVRVRDAGDMAWVEEGAVSGKRTVVVTAPRATVRVRPEVAATPVFTAAKGVVLEISAPVTSGWVKVRHADGASGFVAATDIWGV